MGTTEASMTLFLFEFMDQQWIPASLHATLREVLEFHHKVTLSYYYAWAAREVLKRAETTVIERVIELGAGSAGFSQTLALSIRDQKKNLQVEICDLRPDVDRYRELEKLFPGLLRARMEPVDLTVWTPPPGRLLLIMSAAFHHIPPRRRSPVLASLIKHPTMIFESISRNLVSMIGCALGCVPGMLTPLYFFKRSAGRWRRFIWCWFLPVAPFMVAFDGVVSCLRCWTEEEWRKALGKLGMSGSSIVLQRRGLGHMISW